MKKNIISPDNVKKWIKPQIPFIIIFVILQIIVVPDMLLPRLYGFNLPNIPAIVYSLVLTLALRLFVYIRASNAKKYRKDIEYGSARWGT